MQYIREVGDSCTWGIFIRDTAYVIVIQWSMTLCFIESKWYMPHPVWKCLTYWSPQPPYLIKWELNRFLGKWLSDKVALYIFCCASTYGAVTYHESRCHKIVDTFSKKLPQRSFRGQFAWKCRSYPILLTSAWNNVVVEGHVGVITGQPAVNMLKNAPWSDLRLPNVMLLGLRLCRIQPRLA